MAFDSFSTSKEMAAKTGITDFTKNAWDESLADFRASMRAFVELVATIADSTIEKALRDLWTAHYEFVKATMWGSNEAAKAEFKAKEAELMNIINPAYQMAA